MATNESTLLENFGGAFNAHNVNGIMAMMTDDCIFENTFPPPDGSRHQGQAAVRAFWEEFFQGSPSAHFDTIDEFVSGDRAVQRWIYTWVDAEGVEGHISGVDVFRFRDGLISEKLSYVKG